MSYQHSLNMFTRSTNAFQSSMSALEAEFTLSPFYDFQHFAAMALSFYFHIYNVMVNLLLALCSIPITLYSIFADDSCNDAYVRGVHSMFIHTFAALIYAVNLVITPVSVVLRTLVSMCMDADDSDLNKEGVSEEIEAATNTSFAGDVQDDLSIPVFVSQLNINPNIY